MEGGGGGHWKAEGGHSSLLWPELDLTGLVLNSDGVGVGGGREGEPCATYLKPC